MVRKIIKFPAPSLRAVCREVSFPFDPFMGLTEHVQDLYDTLAATPTGLALASNQITEDGWRIFVVKERPGDLNRLPSILINPTYTPNRDVVKSEQEGCLSIPELSIFTDRAIRVAVHFFDIHGQKHSLVVSGMDARIVQHEVDHLDGKLLYDRAPRDVQVRVRAEAIRNRKRGR